MNTYAAIVAVAFLPALVFVVAHWVERWRKTRLRRAEKAAEGLYSDAEREGRRMGLTGDRLGEYIETVRAAEWVMTSNGWQLVRYLRKPVPGNRTGGAWFVHVMTKEGPRELRGPDLVSTYDRAYADHLRRR